MPETKYNNLSHPINTDTEDIIGNAPGWLLKSGISVFGLVITAIFVLSAFIRFPDKITSIGVMTSETPPIEHKLASGGIVDTIFVQNNSEIQKGEPILLIKNPCKVGDIAVLEQFILDYEKVNRASNYLKLSFPTSLQLGGLQPEYANLELLFVRLCDKLRNINTKEQISIFKEEINHIDQLNKVLSRQQELAKEELSLVKKNHSRNKTLRKDSVISDLELEKSTIELVGYQKNIENLSNTLIENEIRKNQLRLQIHQLKEGKSDFVNEYTLKIQESVSKLKQDIKDWKENYYMTAEISGIISFASFLTEKVRLSPDQTVANIIPTHEASKKFVRAFALSKGMGEVEVGNKVILKIDGYPYQEYGTVTSQVSSISLLPKKDDDGNLAYELIVSLPNTIKTNYGIEIPYSPNTSIIAEVITEDASILQRVFNEFLSLLKNR